MAATLSPFVAVSWAVLWDGTNDTDVVDLLKSLDGWGASIAGTPKVLTVTYGGDAYSTFPLNTYLNIGVRPDGSYTGLGQGTYPAVQFKTQFVPGTAWT